MMTNMQQNEAIPSR